jgi:AraC-like DNA-binding protein
VSVSYRAARAEDTPQLWTVEALAAEFGLSVATIQTYSERRFGLIPPALGNHPSGFNYDHTHYEALRRHCAEMQRRVPLRERRNRPHVVIRERRPEGPRREVA